MDYKPEEGAFWDVLYRWAPDAVREGIGLSVGEALSALLSKYLDCVIAADQQEVESFFGNFVARSRVKEAINALQAARELDFIRVGSRSLIQLAQPKAPVINKNRVGTGTPAVQAGPSPDGFEEGRPGGCDRGHVHQLALRLTSRRLRSSPRLF